MNDDVKLWQVLFLRIFAVLFASSVGWIDWIKFHELQVFNVAGTIATCLAISISTVSTGAILCIVWYVTRREKVDG